MNSNRREIRAGWIPASALLTGLLTVAGLTAARAQTSPAPVRPLVCGVSLIDGAYPGWFGAGTDPVAALDAFAASTGGRYPGSFSLWSNWETPGPAPRGRDFPSFTLLDALSRRGVTPMIFWEPTGDAAINENIAAGKYDAYVRAWARRAKGWGRKVIVRFAHEQNGSWFPWSPGKNGNTGDSYIRMWKRVVRLVRNAPSAPLPGEGAKNVAFFWCPNATNAAGRSFLESWPGDDWTQYVGIDGYKWSNDGGGSMRGMFENPIRTLRNLPSRSAAGGTSNKPIIIGETGIAAGGLQSNRAAWIREGYRELQARWGKLYGITYFNIDMSVINGQPNWTLAGRPSILGAYRNIVNDPAFQGKY